MFEMFVQLKEEVTRFGLAYVFNRYYSLYRAEVVDAEDPDGRGRVRVVCRAVSRTGTLDWAVPVSGMAGKARGLFFPPDKGDFVWVGFEEGDLSVPYYLGGWWAKSELGDDFVPGSGKPPTVRGIETPSGHKVVFTDTDGKESVLIFHRGGSNILFKTDKSIVVTTKGGHIINLDDNGQRIDVKDSHGNELTTDSSGVVVKDVNGNKVQLGSGGISTTAAQATTETSPQKHTLSAPLVDIGNAATSPAVHGDQLMSYLNQLIAWLAGHQHIQIGPTSPASVAPTGPPPPPVPTIISKTVKLNST